MTLTNAVDYYKARNGKTHRAFRNTDGTVSTLCGLGNNKPARRPQAIHGQCDPAEITCGRCR